MPKREGEPTSEPTPEIKEVSPEIIKALKTADELKGKFEQLESGLNKGEILVGFVVEKFKFDNAYGRGQTGRVWEITGDDPQPEDESRKGAMSFASEGDYAGYGDTEEVTINYDKDGVVRAGLRCQGGQRGTGSYFWVNRDGGSSNDLTPSGKEQAEAITDVVSRITDGIKGIRIQREIKSEK